MKKRNVLPKTMMAMLAVVMLGGCANKSQTKSDDPTTSDRSEYSETTETSEATESSEDEAKEAAKGKIVTEDVESVTLRFYVGYNISGGHAIGDSIPCLTVDLEGEDLDLVAAMLPKLERLAPGQGSGVGYIADKYELTINGDQVITIGDRAGYYREGNALFKVPEKLFETVDRIAEEYSDKEVYKTLDSKEITVVDNKQGIAHPISDPDQLENILAVKYYVIDDDEELEEMLANNDIAYVLNMDDGESLFVFYASVRGGLIHNDGTRELVFIQGMEDYLNSIIK